MKTADFYNKIAPEYERLIDTPEVNAQLMKHAREIINKHEIKTGSILDVGCGPGNLKKTLGDNFTYTGIDIAEKMLEEARAKGYETIHGRIEEELGSIPDKSFDYVVSLSALHFVKDIDFVINEFERIAKKAFLISLADLTSNYIENFPVEEELFNHSKLKIENPEEDIFFEAWRSPTVNEVVSERMILKYVK